MIHFLILSLGLFLTHSSLASDPENFIQYRQNYMEAVGGHMGATSRIVRGKVRPKGHLLMHTRALAALSRDITQLFPEGSDFGETRAKETIWEQWSKFEEAAQRFRDTAEQLAATVEAGEHKQVRRHYKALSDACKHCHKKFRTKKDE